MQALWGASRRPFGGHGAIVSGSPQPVSDMGVGSRLTNAVPDSSGLWQSLQMRTHRLAATLLVGMSCAFPMSSTAATPAPVVTSASASGNTMTFEWTYNTKVDAFTVQHSCDGGVQWTTINQVPASQRIWTFDTAVTADNCVVRIAARLDNVDGIFSDPVAPAVLGSFAPVDVIVDPATGDITWTGSAATNIVAYEVQQSTDEGATWDVLATMDGDITDYANDNVTAGAAFRIVAIAADGQRFIGEIQRALDPAAADVVRTASVVQERLLIIGGVVALLALLIGMWQLRRRRTARLTHGFEDFDALTRR